MVTSTAPRTAPPKPPPMSPPPTTNGNGGTASKTEVPKLGRTEAVFHAPRIVLNAVEGWGKTSTIAFAPNAAIVQARGETGYETLLGAELVPSIDTAKVESWSSLMTLLDSLINSDIAYKVIGLDALGGIERLCHEAVCNRDFAGQWGDKGFNSFQKGYDMALTDWLAFLGKLDALKNKGITVVLLSHNQIKNFKNPLGPDYDRYGADVHHKTWAATHRWADAVLFGTFITIVDDLDKKGKKGKGIGGTDRIIYTERRDAYDAKNRYGLPGEIEIPNDPSQIWPTLWAAITNGKEVK